MNIQILLGLNYQQAKDAFDREYLVRLMVIHRGKVRAMAKHAGMNREAIHRLLNRLDLRGHLELARVGKLKL